MSEHLMQLMVIPVFVGSLCGFLYLWLWLATADVRARHKREVKELRAQYGDEYANWYKRTMRY